MIESIKELCRTNEYFNINDEKDLFGRVLDMVFGRYKRRDYRRLKWLLYMQKKALWQKK